MRLLLATLAFLASSALAVEWIDALKLTLHGQGFPQSELESPYDRLPADAKGKVIDPVWSLSTNSAGLQVDFFTNSSSISTQISLRYDIVEMWHFPSTGVAGVDLYRWDTNSSSWRWVGTSRTNVYKPDVEQVLVSDLPGAPEPALYRLHLPTYNAPTKLAIGIDEGSMIWTAPLEDGRARVVHYGTSIAQGGVASRPGFAFTNMYSREIGVDTLNFGFSGHGLMQDAVAEFLVKTNPDVFVLDCNPNMASGSAITPAAQSVVQLVRAALPNAAIIMSEGTRYGAYWVSAGVREFQDGKRAGLRAAYSNLTQHGLTNVTYVEGDSFFTPTLLSTSPTVGGTHPTDLGMVAMAARWEEVIASALGTTAEMMKEAAQKRTASRVPGTIVPPTTSPIPPPSIPPQPFHLTQDVVEGFMRQEDRFARTGRDQEPQAPDTTVWTSGMNLSLLNHLVPPTTTPNYYSRFPSAAEGKIPDANWELLLMSTGVAIGFETNSTAIALSYTTLMEPASLWHMPMSGTAGADLHRWDPATKAWRFVATVEDLPSASNWSTTVTLLDGMDQNTTDPCQYLLFLPGRNVPANDLKIGTLAGSVIRPLSQIPTTKVVWSGTSILQAGVAARPGQMYSNVISMEIGAQISNFGTAGNGRMNLSVCSFLAQIPTDLFILDDLPNLSASGVAERGVPDVLKYRSIQPKTPIVLAEGTTYGDSWLHTSTYEGQQAKREALTQVYQTLLAKGQQDIHYVKGDPLFTPTANAPATQNPTVGGTHPSALGHREVANFYSTFLPTLLPSSKPEIKEG